VIVTLPLIMDILFTGKKATGKDILSWIRNINSNRIITTVLS
jgi:hypothetical protein